MPKLLIGIIGIAVIGVGVVLVLAVRAPKAPIAEKNVAQDASITQKGITPGINPLGFQHEGVRADDGYERLKPEIPQGELPEKLDEETKTKLQLERLAATFVERFLSYSSDGGFENIDSLKILMTPKARAFADKFKANVAQGFSPAHKFYGISTKSIATEVINLGTDFATIKIETQRQEIKDSESKILNQDVEVNLVRQDDDWIVDGVFLK